MIIELAAATDGWLIGFEFNQGLQEIFLFPLEFLSFNQLLEHVDLCSHELDRLY